MNDESQNELVYEQVFQFKLEENNFARHVGKAAVNGGHIYSEIIDMNGQISNAMCFVPDIDLTRYKAHLRDAYKKGYEDGQADAKNGVTSEAEAPHEA